MTGTGIEAAWVLPAVKEAWKHREEILGLWQRVAARLFGSNRKIAFTGMPGAGKTVLFDYITAQAFKAGYSPPQTSRAAEKGKIWAPRKEVGLVVVPGQDSPPRLRATDALFSGDDAVDGVVHVVCNGFAAVRSIEARQILVNHGIATVESFVAEHRKLELNDLKNTCELIRHSFRRRGRPSWMVVAVSKVDLYHDTIGDAAAYYSPGADSEFVRCISELEHHIGTDNFRWTAHPVCGWLEDFSWNGEQVLSSIKPQARDHYLAGLTETIDGYLTDLAEAEKHD
jgi:hypothetical protein